MSIEPQRPLHRWLNAVALALSLLVFAAWLAQAVYILSCTKVGLPIYRQVVLFDAMPPGILGGGMLIAAAVARHRGRMRGARLFGFGGIVALSLSILLTSGMGRLAEDIRLSAYAELAATTWVLLGAKVISANFIGGIRWRAGKASPQAQPNLPQATVAAPAASRPVGQLPDLLSLLVVLFIWFCPVPTTSATSSHAVPLYVAGASTFVAGFPVGLVGVIALLAAGLLRTGRDRNRIVALELFGVLALGLVFAAAAMPYAMNFAGITVTAGAKAGLVKSLMLSSWALFASAIAAKLACIAAGSFRRRERMQFSLLGMLAFIVGCGALAMYWRVWRS